MKRRVSHLTAAGPFITEQSGPSARPVNRVVAPYWRSARIPNVRYSYSGSLSGPCPGTSRWFRLDRTDFRSSLQNPPIPRRGSG